MPTLTINGQKVTVGDGFLSLPPDEQNATVDEIAKSMGITAQPQQPQSQGDRGGLAFANRGIANVLGAPVDLVNYGLGAAGLPVSDEPFLGSESIAGGMENIGIPVSEADQRPETVTEYIGRGTGEATGALVPFLGGARRLQAARGAVASGVGDDLVRPFVQAPKRALAAETAAGAGAGTGAAVADQISEGDNRGARMAGEFIGGVAGGMGPSAAGRAVRMLPGTGTAIGVTQKAIAPFTEAGGMERARSRMRSLAEDPDAARAALDAPNEAGLSPATQTGDPNLMGLERAVRDTSPPTEAAMRQGEAEAAQALREMVATPAQGANVGQTQEFLANRLSGLTNKIDARVTNAAANAQQRIEKLTPRQKASQSAMIVRDELEDALKMARLEERVLWEKVPQNAEVPTENTRNAFAQLVRDTPRAQRDDIPAKARQFLDRDQSNLAFSDTETVKEMHGLYSAMREESRKARAAGEANRGRMSDIIADALLEDMGALGNTAESGNAINQARAFSRKLNERFKRGSVGRIMGYAREGGQSMPAEMTLDASIGRGGTRGAVSVDELRAAAGQSGDQGMQDYLLSRFRDATVRNGQFDPRRAESFIRQNAELLDRFPGLKQKMQDAQQAQSSATRVSDSAGRRASALRDPKQSRAAAFLNAPVDQEIQTVLRSRDPGAAARELKRQASKDPTGDAARGLKGGFVDFLMSRASGGGFDEMGESLVSGRAMLNALNDKRIGAVASEFLTSNEMNRLRRIAKEFAKMETARGRVPDVGGVMKDLPNSIIGYLARVMAARAGAQAGSGTSGASLLTAQLASKRMQGILESLTNDRAEALIREAITGNHDLFRILLSKSAMKSEKAASRIIETLAALSGGAVTTDQ